MLLIQVACPMNFLLWISAIEKWDRYLPTTNTCLRIGIKPQIKRKSLKMSVQTILRMIIMLILVVLFAIWAVDRIYHKERFFKSGHNVFRFVNFWGRLTIKKPFVNQEKTLRIINEVSLEISVIMRRLSRIRFNGITERSWFIKKEGAAVSKLRRSIGDLCSKARFQLNV